MSSTEMPLNILEKRRKQLKFRSWHRGTKEADLLLGGFADETLDSMGLEELDLYEDLLTIPDPVLTAWMTGMQDCPAGERNAVMDRLLAFCEKKRQL
ncbi:FAD assembly factor SdhE [Kiloniella sp. b19]|uniref:FAD assembly factor SdhE n=1 Tax=Kiloniella sp. GXU_MW_B19 TaxID=3141326 RepID=UPI0031DDAC4E